MRKLGYSIEAVRDFQDTKDPDEALQRLKERSAAIHEQWEEMMRIDHAILRKIQFIEDSKDEIDYEGFRRWWNTRSENIFPLERKTELYAGESFYFYPTLVFYEGTKKEFGALLTDEVPEENVDIHTIPAGTYVVGYHKGAYEADSGQLSKGSEEWGQNLDLEDGILAVNIIDQFVEQNNENYATRIEVRIADTN